LKIEQLKVKNQDLGRKLKMTAKKSLLLLMKTECSLKDVARR